MSDSEWFLTSIGVVAGYPGLLVDWVGYGPRSSPVFAAPLQGDSPLYPSAGPLLAKYGTSGVKQLVFWVVASTFVTPAALKLFAYAVSVCVPWGTFPPAPALAAAGDVENAAIRESAKTSARSRNLATANPPLVTIQPTAAPSSRWS